MKILLRHSNSGLYYAGQDAWTSNHSEAYDFQHVNAAIDAVRDDQVKELEVLMHFEGSPFDIPLMIHGCGR